MTVFTGKRAANKARTRDALVAAAREVAGERGLEHVTAEEIADRAGVSRRTFFNYFTGIESIVAAGLSEPLRRLAEALLRRPPEEDPLGAIAAALREQPLGEDVLLGWGPPTPASTSPQRQSLHLRIWQHHEEWLVGVLREWLHTDDELRVRSLAAVLMSLFDLVQREWLPRVADLEPAQAVDAFTAQLQRALEHARVGWRTA